MKKKYEFILSGQSSSSGTLDIFITCRNTIAKGISEKKPPADIIDNASRDLPELRKLRDFLPKTLKDASEFLKILLLVLNIVIFLIEHLPALKSSDAKQIIINQTIQNYYYLQNPSSGGAQLKVHSEKKKQRILKNRKSNPKGENNKAKKKKHTQQ